MKSTFTDNLISSFTFNAERRTTRPKRLFSKGRLVKLNRADGEIKVQTVDETIDRARGRPALRASTQDAANEPRNNYLLLPDCRAASNRPDLSV